jgi:hypothetical protein
MISQNIWLISVKKLGTFSYDVWVFLPRKFKLISENFNFSPNTNKKFSFSEQQLKGRCCSVALEGEGTECRLDFWEMLCGVNGYRNKQ